MDEHMDALYKFGELLDREIEKMTEKGSLNPSDLDVADKAICLSIKIHDHISGMPEEEHEGRSGFYIPPYGSYRMRSYGSNSYGDNDSRSYGRRMNGMSGHSIKDRMIARLESMYDEAESDHEKHEIRNEIERIKKSDD